MKKFLAILLAGLMIFSLCACEKSEAPATETPEAAASETTTPESDNSDEALVALKAYYDSFMKCDGRAIMEAIVTPYVLSTLGPDSAFENEDQLAERHGTAAKAQVDYWENTCGKNLTAAIDNEDITEYNEEDIKKINKYLAEEFEYPENFVSELKLIKAKLTVKGDNSDTAIPVELSVAKVDGKWYVDFVTGNESDINEILERY